MTTEIEIARPVVEWFQANGWTVYQEVQPDALGPCADIVATKGSLSWIVEVKTSRSLTVLDQALGWMGEANLVSVATPRPKRTPLFRRASWDRVCEMFGVGCFSIDINRDLIDISPFPRLNRKLLGTDGIRNALREEHRNWAEAGNPDGARWTPFQGLVRAVQQAVKANPGLRVNDFVDATEHHYASDRGAVAMIKRNIKDGLFPGVTHRNGKLFPEGFNRHSMHLDTEA